MSVPRLGRRLSAGLLSACAIALVAVPTAAGVPLVTPNVTVEAVGGTTRALGESFAFRVNVGHAQGLAPATGTLSVFGWGPDDPACDNPKAFETTASIDPLLATAAGDAAQTGEITLPAPGIYRIGALYEGDTTYALGGTGCIGGITVTVTATTALTFSSATMDGAGLTKVALTGSATVPSTLDVISDTASSCAPTLDAATARVSTVPRATALPVSGAFTKDLSYTVTPGTHLVCAYLRPVAALFRAGASRLATAGPFTLAAPDATPAPTTPPASTPPSSGSSSAPTPPTPKPGPTVGSVLRDGRFPLGPLRYQSNGRLTVELLAGRRVLGRISVRVRRGVPFVVEVPLTTLGRRILARSGDAPKLRIRTTFRKSAGGRPKVTTAPVTLPAG